MIKRILLRCEAGPQIGGGHVMRSLTLGQALADEGAEIALCVSQQTLQFMPWLDHSGFKITHAEALGSIQLPSDWDETCEGIILDGYSFHGRESGLQACPKALRVMLDDMANRTLDCDLLIDPTTGRNPADYSALLPDRCEVLSGTDYALIRHDFVDLREYSLQRRLDGDLKHILISFGMTDPAGITGQVTQQIAEQRPDLTLTVVLWPDAPSRPVIEGLSKSCDNIELRLAEKDMAPLMLKADLAIGAGGGTAIERCVMGLPSIIMVIADNQGGQAEYLAMSGAARQINLSDDWPSILLENLDQLGREPDTLNAMSDASAQVCDGHGPQRLARRILEKLQSGQ